jgi:peroxiredoxin
MYLKTISLFAAGLFVIAGCGGQQTGFTVSGRITGANKDSLGIQEMMEKAVEFRAAIPTDAAGSFRFSDTASNPRLLFLKTKQNDYITLMVLEGEKVTVNAEKGKINETLTITGSPQSELILELNREAVKATDKLNALRKQFQERKKLGNDPQVDSWAQGEYGKLMGQQRDFIREFIELHTAEPACLLALSHQIGQQQILNGISDYDLFKKVDDQLFKKFPKSVLVLNLHKFVESIRPEVGSQASNEKAIGNGTVAPDISMPDPDGNTQTLSSQRGKIVLLDFWAAWCGPCRRENPSLVTAYAKYHDKGFEIFQVSLDKTKPDWVAAIRKDGLNWIHVSDLKFWDSPVARQYGVESIPANFLLDKQGKIIASNLRGAALEEELVKLLR